MTILNRMLAGTLLGGAMVLGSITPLMAKENSTALIQSEQTQGTNTADEIDGLQRFELDEPEEYSAKQQEAEGDGAIDVVPRKVLGEDSRTPVNNPSQRPYSSIARLVITFSNGQQFAGTGFLVSPDTLLTAGHCIYDLDYGFGQARTITAVFDNQTENNADHVYTAKEVFVPSGYINSDDGDTDYDFGLIRLHEPVEDTSRVVRVSTFDAGISRQNLLLAGFPYSNSVPVEEQKMLEARGITDHIIGRRTLMHYIDSASGQSGSPMLDSKNNVVAIHTFARSSEEINGGTAIDSYVLAYVHQAARTQPPVYRLYNPNSGEHFYTPNYSELVFLVEAGWKDEGLAWYSQDGGAPIYRVYNPNAGDHHYTSDRSEVEFLVDAGWQDEGIGWYSADQSQGMEVYRVYNPNAISGAHHFTMDANERDMLVQSGWSDEKTAFYSL